MPMDYWNGTTNATVSLAVIRQPAKVPVTDPRYGGAVLTNPSGLGGLGVELIVDGVVDAYDYRKVLYLYYNPLPVIGPYLDIITYSDVYALIFQALYKPIAKLLLVVDILADIEKGNGTRFTEVLKP
ncbi:hypothetical protein CLAFUW4_13258 [Fulvia fulva]|uniref:Uncharacterized protein n=1 Tax=Passalora fulva TaxID=5499 RepID=A0A9Q8PJI1_PASFU|nr:uncharacterized protein CLAFUR5_13114 [Fulvia fulva]KAK4612019.1 hypothetical protein CLAFUR4_13263 [Fulvia fulva]KAK4612418.1 hypothetical protein CLAFUR0_13268 [Fulvia fulva]UJO23628.1 hypothetical protein CLAFUR5_13114 [Fulvia fulva]WPV20997.1 hypothetical protein CLAFUW4_13258 [Fulvia fulva]WPV36221.1 hypothetical protein CLAFUW7_13265 [Fulvia fulva]